MVETYDLLGGGVGDRFHQAVEDRKRTLKFGEWAELQQQSCEYGGRTLRQEAGYSFRVSMHRYLRERAREIRLERGRCKNPEADADESETTAMRGLKINCAVREEMPQGGGDAPLLSATLPTPRIKDLQEANACLRRLLQDEVPLVIHSIPLDRLRLVCFADSSLGNARGGASQTAHMICAADQDILIGKEAPVSILTYGSHRMQRAGSSTLLMEANPMSGGLADAE